MKYTQFSPLLNYKEPHGEKAYIVTALECSVYLGCADIHPIFGFAYRMLDKDNLYLVKYESKVRCGISHHSIASETYFLL